MMSRLRNGMRRFPAGSIIVVGRKHAKMPERLFDGGDLFGRALLPLAAFGGGLINPAEFAAVRNPVGLDPEAVALLYPFLDLLVGGGLTQHGCVSMVGPRSGRPQTAVECRRAGC